MEKNNKFSYYEHGINTVVPSKDITIEELIRELTNPVIQMKIQKIQEIKHSDKKIEKTEKNKLKKYLNYITPAGIFTKRNKKGIKIQSGYAPIDIDDVDEPEVLKNRLKNDPHIILMFVSPSGKGLKLLIEIPLNVEEYSERVNSYYGYLEKAYNINTDSLDKATSDISRACFLSYDPDFYYNPLAEPFKFIENTVKSKINKTDDNSRSAIEFREIIKLLYLGKTKQEVYEHMETSFDKWNEATESYQTLTFEKAYQYVKINPPKKDDLTDLINALVDEIINQFSVYVLRSDKAPIIYIYNEGIYIPNGKSYLYEFIERSIKKYYTQQLAERVIEKLVPKCYINAKEFFQEEEAHLVPVQNGILNLFTKQLEHFSPMKRFFSKLPVIYDKEAKAEITKKHFETILFSEDIDLMQELYGFLLFRDYKFQKAFIFSGEGANGKSATTDQMKYFLGEENVKNIGMKDLENEKFMKGQLHKKLANLGDDIGKAKLAETKTIKELTGGGMITADIKHNPEAISFTNYAKLIFNANQIPEFEDDSDGIWRRWIFIRFNTRFLSPYDYKRMKKEGTLKNFHRIADEDMGKKLHSQEELSGVLNWALEGFDRLTKQRCFTYAKSLEETKKEMLRYSSRTMEFIYECIEETQNFEEYESSKMLYEKFRVFCKNRKDTTRKIKPENEKEFRRILDQEMLVETKRLGSVIEFRVLGAKYVGEY